ncbi:MAG: hypothetical protein GY757_56720 [bacterium]|nr:hypothetical protein [bacterium]
MSKLIIGPSSIKISNKRERDNEVVKYTINDSEQKSVSIHNCAEINEPLNEGDYIKIWPKPSTDNSYINLKGHNDNNGLRLLKIKIEFVRANHSKYRVKLTRNGQKPVIGKIAVNQPDVDIDIGDDRTDDMKREQ